MDDKTKDVPTPEEIAAEQAALAETKEDEIRANVIAEFGFDETADADRIEKLVKKEMEHSKKLSSAIGQKIKYRDQLSKPKDTDTPKQPEVKGIAPEDIDKHVEEKLAKRDLDEMELPDNIKKEIKDWASFKGISVKQAAKAPHIVEQIKTHEKEQKADEAAINRNNRSGGKKAYSLDNPPQVDMTTAEGRKEWDDYKEWLKKQ